MKILETEIKIFRNNEYFGNISLILETSILEIKMLETLILKTNFGNEDFGNSETDALEIHRYISQPDRLLLYCIKITGIFSILIVLSIL